MSLSPQLTIRNNVLRDQTTGARHLLDAPAVILLTQLARGVSYGQFVDSSDKLGLHHSQTAELVGFLNIIGGLVRKRTTGALLKTGHTWITHLLLGIRYAPLSWRKYASKGNIAFATLRATVPVITGAFVVAGMQLYVGFGNLHQITVILAYGVGVLITSIAYHELSHAYIIRKTGSACNVLQTGMHLGIIHPHAPPVTELVSSLAGPLVGAAICVLSGGIMLFLSQATLALVSFIISICHFCSLLPIYGDGKSFVNALREKRENP